jgi:hypothetical protein
MEAHAGLTKPLERVVLGGADQGDDGRVDSIPGADHGHIRHICILEGAGAIRYSTDLGHRLNHYPDVVAGTAREGAPQEHHAVAGDGDIAAGVVATEHEASTADVGADGETGRWINAATISSAAARGHRREDYQGYRGSQDKFPCHCYSQRCRCRRFCHTPMHISRKKRCALVKVRSESDPAVLCGSAARLAPALRSL